MLMKIFTRVQLSYLDLFITRFSVNSENYFCKRHFGDAGNSIRGILTPHSFSSHKIVDGPFKYKIYSSNMSTYGADLTGVNDYTLRTHNCGELREFHEGMKVNLFGWVHFFRLSKFIIIRDAYGSVQVLLSNLETPLPSKIFLESVIEVSGTVVLRPESQINKEMATGAIEIAATSVNVISEAMASVPFQIRDYNKIHTKTLNRYRYLALRFPECQQIFRLRSEVIFKMREFLITQKNFVEVETPTLFKKTPGGAQEFIVPTHKKNEFYSLVQSPQQLKQLLMVGSTDRYFQIARCYRDETTQSDRQPEFTQLDIELSFTNFDGVLRLTEDILTYCWPCHKTQLTTPFPRISYHEAMEKYGSDKPCVLDKFLIQSIDSSIKDDTENFSYVVVVPNGKSTYKKLRSYIDLLLKKHSTKIYIFKISNKDKFYEDIEKISTGFDMEKFKVKVTVNQDDLVILTRGSEKWKTLETIGFCRRKVIDEMNLIDDMNKRNVYEIFWVVDFPLFEKNESNEIKSAHHPFTQPQPGDVQLLSSDPLKAKALAYDLVINGSEIAGGSIRIHNAEMQRNILKLLNLDEKDFSHLLNALEMGCPPHGGIALGLDRLIAILCNRKSIKDVIAFPKGNEGKDFMTDCPSDIPIMDKIRYHIVNNN